MGEAAVTTGKPPQHGVPVEVAKADRTTRLLRGEGAEINDGWVMLGLWQLPNNDGNLLIDHLKSSLFDKNQLMTNDYKIYDKIN